MNRIMIHRLHRSVADIKEDCHGVPYKHGVIDLLSIDITDEEFVFIKLKYKMSPHLLVQYTDMPTYLILHEYYNG